MNAMKQYKFRGRHGLRHCVSDDALARKEGAQLQRPMSALQHRTVVRRSRPQSDEGGPSSCCDYVKFSASEEIVPGN